MWRRLKAAIGRVVPGSSRAAGDAKRAQAHTSRAAALGSHKPSASIWLWLAIAGLAIIAIWWLGPRWEIFGSHPLGPWLNRLLASLALTVIFCMVWGLCLMRRLREMHEAQEHTEQRKIDATLAEVELQEASLNATLDELIGSLGASRNARYKLPWYLVLGVENAGKTSLINRSGQSFALTHVMKASGQGKRARYGFDWWIGDRAVLIDPDGELLTQQALNDGEPAELESRLWDHFITWLERERTQRPLDGIVLVLDLARLSHAKVGVRKAYAALLRARMRELMERLSTRLPVYVTFSKMDLLHGFDEFFRHYSRAERRAPLGFTFSASSLDMPGLWEEEFARAYDNMLEQLNSNLPALLAECRDTEGRESLFRFVRQLAGLRDVLLGFLKEALSSDRFSTAAMVRGSYFTSVYQQGVPEDPFADAAARRYGMSDTTQPAHRTARSALYFSEELFSKVIYPEAGLASDNARVIQRRHRLHRASAMACLCIGISLVGGWSYFYQQNASALAAVEHKARDFAAEHPTDFINVDPSGYTLLAPLDRLRDTTLEFGDYRSQVPVLADMGLYQGNNVGRKVENAYLTMLETRFLPGLMVGIMEDMNRASPGSNEKLALLRMLRMLADASGRQANRVHDFMADRWQRLFPHQGNIQRRLLKHLDYALAHTDLTASVAEGKALARQAMAPLRESIQAAQHELDKLPMVERVYAAMIADSTRHGVSSLDLRQGVGPAWGTVFKARDNDPHHINIPGLVTRDGFEHYFLSEIDQATELALIDLWVLGQRDDADFTDIDRRRLREDLRQRYASDYRVTWRDALAHVQLVALPDLDQAIMVMDALLDTRRPLDRLLDEVTHNTQLYPQLPVDDEAARQALDRSPRYQLAAAIDKPFTTLNQLTEEREDGSADIEQIKQAIGELRDYLSQIQTAGNPGRTAFVTARDRLVLSASDPIHTLKRIARDAPAPVNRILDSLADQSWQLLLSNAIRHLEGQWLDEVITPYRQRLAGRYPLNPNATREVTLEDFERFFGPKGTLATFHQRNLQPFLEEVPKQLQNAEGDPLLRSDVLVSLERAERIREAYFDGDGILDVAFSLEPLRLSPNKRRSVISVDGQLIEYLHGANISVPMIWPNSLRSRNESRVTLAPDQVNHSPRSLRQQGAWAWFRLVDNAEVIGISERELDLRFSIDGGTMHYRLRAERAHNPFTRPLVSGFGLPTALYGQAGGSDASET